jgi:hypothetical protein
MRCGLGCGWTAHDGDAMSDRLTDAPIGTKAPAIMGGRWYRTEHGWKWNGPDGSGSTFPNPGGDWDGDLIYPDGTIDGRLSPRLPSELPDID